MTTSPDHTTAPAADPNRIPRQVWIISGVAMLGAVFYEVIGGVPSRASFVSGLVVTAWVDAVLLAAAAALTFLLPRAVPRSGSAA